MKQNLSISNKKAYESEDIISYYNSLNFLYKPEVTILDILSDRMKETRMLDIGVGAGRTTQHFASIVKEYVGIDYSDKMIDICRKKYSHLFKNVFFEVCDVKLMGIFADNSFDLILFSFNGIDSMTHDDRLSALHEINRVCAKDGFFCFSTHNLNSIDKILKINIFINPLKTTKKILKYLLIRFLNEDFANLKSREYAVINDGVHRFRLWLYYIKPEDQIKQLNKAGFKNVRVFSQRDGIEIEDKITLSITTESWLYYLCNT